MARELARIMTALTDKPWAITQGGLDTLVALAARQTPSFEALARKAEQRATDGQAPASSDGDEPKRDALQEGDEYLRDVGAAFVREGVAVVPVYGPLIAKASWLEDLCGITSYERIRNDLAAAVSYGALTAVLLDVDSPGGQVTGCSETASMIR